MIVRQKQSLQDKVRTLAPDRNSAYNSQSYVREANKSLSLIPAPSLGMGWEQAV